LPKLKKIAVSSLSFSKNTALMAELTDAGFDVTPNRSGKVMQGDELGAFLAGHDGAIVGTEIIDGKVLDLCPDLKLISKYGVGLDNLDEAELKRRGIPFACTPGVNKRSVAELVLGFMLGHCRNIYTSLEGMREGRWLKDGGRELSSMTVGIVGFGHTGSEVAKLLQPFGTKILYVDIVDKTKEAAVLGAQRLEYDSLLRTSDVISFHVPATPQTKRMFGPKEIEIVRPHGLIVNTSRGSVVEFDATCAAVIDGKLGGFAADVFPVEPDDFSRFRGQPRLYFTPHIGGNSQEAVLAMGRAAIAALTESRP
jgi:D-3-phosphoglycerate dehydrogenase